MFRNLFKNRASTKYPIGLGMAELPKSIYKGKQPITSKDFKVYVNDHFATKIKEIGFKGRDFNYYREQENYTECVNFWTYKIGGAIQVDLMIKFNGIKYPDEETEIKPRFVKQENAEFIRRLSPHKISDNSINVWFWIFNEKPERNIEIVNDIWRLFESCGIDFFNEFQNHKEYIRKVETENYMNFPDFYTKRISGKFEVGVVYFLFRYWKKYEDNPKATEFAKKGIQIATDKEDINYKTEFEEYINK